jgi:uncharacterized protein (TIGR00251 family)
LTRARPWTLAADGLVVLVRLVPRSSRDEIESAEQLADGRAVLKVRVRARPIEGEANAALLRLLAGTLGVAVRDVRLVSGTTARIKRLEVAGAGAALAAALERICAVR